MISVPAPISGVRSIAASFEGIEEVVRGAWNADNLRAADAFDFDAYFDEETALDSVIDELDGVRAVLEQVAERNWTWLVNRTEP